MSLRAAFAKAAAAAVSIAALAVAAQSPFAYPQSLLQDRPSSGAPATTGITFGGETATLEKTQIREIAAKLGARLTREGAGDFRRDWFCLLANDTARGPSTIWIIASDSHLVTEAQMEFGTPKAKVRNACRPLEARFLPVSVGGVSPGMAEEDIFRVLDIPTHSADDGWKFWSTKKTLRDGDTTRLQMNWTGVLVKNGHVRRVFTSQVTNP